MRIVLILVTALVAIWLWRNSRELPPDTSRPKPSEQPKPPQVMVACAYCQLHVPASDTIKGEHGQYCSAAHRQLAET